MSRYVRKIADKRWSDKAITSLTFIIWKYDFRLISSHASIAGATVLTNITKDWDASVNQAQIYANVEQQQEVVQSITHYYGK